jgi:hypothetical protein
MALQKSICVSTLHIILCHIEGQQLFGIQANRFLGLKGFILNNQMPSNVFVQLTSYCTPIDSFVEHFLKVSVRNFSYGKSGSSENLVKHPFSLFKNI